MRRVVINGKQYAVGLDWFPLREQSKPEVIQEAEANYPDSNLVVMLKEQYGLGESGKSGVASWKRTSALAAALLPYTDAVHVFTLIDADTNKPFWWVFGVRKGLISAQSADFSDEMSANEYAAAMFDSLGVPESDAFDVQTSLALLSERLAAQKKEFWDASRLVPLRETTRDKLIRVALWGIFFGFGWWGISTLLEYQAAQELAEQARIALQNKEIRTQELTSHPEKLFPSKWMTAPAPAAVMLQCVPAMFDYPTAANGWGLSSLSCQGNRLVAEWNQTPFSDYQYLPFNAVLDAKQPKKARSAAALNKLPEAHRTIAELLPQDEASRRLYAFTQHFSLKTKLMFAKRETRDVEKITITCPWVRGTWEISNLPAVMITDYVSLSSAIAIPGLLLNEIVFTKNTWTLKGELYAR